MADQPGKKPHRKDLRNFDGMLHTALAAHFRAGGSRYSKTEYSPLYAFRPSHLAAWIPHVMRYWFHKKHPFPDYTTAQAGNGIWEMADRTTLSVAGDWGTGTDEAQLVAERIHKFAPDFTVHLGDVYFVGGETEVKENFLGEPTSPYEPVKWPMGRLGGFALSGNHEMYARGHAYFRDVLPRMGLREAAAEWGSGQWASFFCLDNKYWRVIGLDTGYNATGFDWGKMPVFEKSKFLRTSARFKPRCDMPSSMLSWLQTVVQPDRDKRGLILMTHHGSHSAFSDWYQIPAQQLARVIHRPVIWFWGHEHKLAIYDRFNVPDGIVCYGRCVGHGGMPVERGKDPDIDCSLLAWDNRCYHNGEKIDAGFNGHVNLSFDGPQLHADYRDLNDELLFTEDWRLDLQSGEFEGPRLKQVLEDPAIHCYGPKQGARD